MDFSLVTAINGRRIVTFYYSNVRRTVEPHTYGADHKHIDKLVGWQISGKPGDREEWREYFYDKISLLQSTQATFSKPRDGYKRNDPAMSTIYAQI